MPLRLTAAIVCCVFLPPAIAQDTSPSSALSALHPQPTQSPNDSSHDSQHSGVALMMILGSSSTWKTVNIDENTHLEARRQVSEMLDEIQRLTQSAQQALRDLRAGKTDRDDTAVVIAKTKHEIGVSQARLDAQAQRTFDRLNSDQQTTLIRLLVEKQGALSVLNKYVADRIGLADSRRFELADLLLQDRDRYSREIQGKLLDAPEDLRGQLVAQLTVQWENRAGRLVEGQLDPEQRKRLDPFLPKQTIDATEPSNTSP